MEKVDLNLVARRLRDGEITLEHATATVIDFIYKNRFFFGLGKLTEDQLHDFMIYEMEHLPGIFENFNSKEATLLTYLQGHLKLHICTWIKRHARKHTDSRSMETLELDMLSDSADRYYENEYSVSLPDFKDDTESCSPGGKKEKPVLRRRMFSHLTSPELIGEKLALLKKEAVLILALKISYYITEEMIQKVLEVTGMEEKEFKMLQEKALHSIKNKIKLRTGCINCRNNAFYFHRKYEAEKKILDSDTVWHNTISQKYTIQTENWQERNRRLKMKKYSAIVSNRKVSQLLNLESRHVDYVLKRVAENIDIISSWNYDEGHENLLGNIKSSQAAGNAANISPAYNRNSKSGRNSV